MKDLEGLNKSEIKGLINACEKQLINIEEQDKKDKIERARMPLKTKIKDLQKYDYIYLIETYPVTEVFKEGYRILKCYVSGISFHKDEQTGKKHISISISHDQQPAGSYGMYVAEKYFDSSCFLYGGGSRFYTLDIDNWKRDFISSYDSLIEEKKESFNDQIEKMKTYKDKLVSDEDIINIILKDVK